MDYPLFDFTVASLLMGLAIGTDVAIATLLRAKQLNTLRLCVIWIVGVSATHTLFPMIGYLLSYFSIQIIPGITPLIGLIAFYCIFRFLKDELSEYAGTEQQQESSDKQLTLTLGLILAVSWDALWSGPAKSAQVVNWPELLVWLSFLLVGMLVSLLALSSLMLARSSVQHWHRVFERYAVLGYWLQYSVIAYFGLLALFRYTLQMQIYWWQILLIAALLMGVTMQLLRLRERVVKF